MTDRRWIRYGLAAAVLLAVVTGMLALHRRHTVEAIKPVRGPAVQAVYATGTVEATVMMPIAPRSSARLMELNADEGSRVTKDQVLAQLEDEDLRQSLAEAQAREAFAEGEYQRNAKLTKGGYAAREAYERAKADWEAAKAATEAARARLSYLQLLAPADGTVIRRDGEVGELIPANQAVFWLSCCAPLRISTEVDEEDIALVEPGQKVLIRADAFPDQVFDGTVESITPKGDPVARSYRVRVTFTGEVPLMIGMTAETNIVVREAESALLVPSPAVTQGYVWLVEGKRLVRRPVTVGARGESETEILEGVTETDTIVKEPTGAEKEHQRVVPRLTAWK